MSTSVTLRLTTAPPSLNNAFSTVPGGRRIKSPKYRAWIEQAGWEVVRQVAGRAKPVVPGPYRLTIEIGEHLTKADLDNLIKPISDLLVSLKVTPDDSKASEFTIRRAGRDDVRVIITDTSATAISPESAEMDYFIANATLTRRAQGETQQIVARNLGLTRQSVSQYENDERAISLELACTWARSKGLRLALLPVEG